MEQNTLTIFEPLIAKWFSDKFGSPTEVQQKAWPVIADGKHVLISAPTGTGKTLTAFLWAINQLINKTWECGCVRVLYISPLKALNSDIRENLLIPLSDLRRLSSQNGIQLPSIKVQTRSGDTSYIERRSMVKNPPEIFITTPESLNLILSSPRSRNMLCGLKTVILDEIHAIASDKRGSYLMTAIERLELLSKGFQRIALSATVRPLSAVAAFVGGKDYYKEGSGYHYTPRKVHIVDSNIRKKLKVSVESIDNSIDHDEDNLWRNLALKIQDTIRQNTATLIFVNNRRLAERLTLYINEGCEQTLTFSHHGSLSREIRQSVERKLKNGELKAIVATSTLEMGIDVGAIDEVIMVQTPPQVSSTLQRVGRAGHSVHRESIGTIIPLHGLDFLHAAIMTRLAVQGNIEEVNLIDNPLDILSQVLTSMIGIESWDLDELYQFIISSAPFYTLLRDQFDSIIQMLAGRYRDCRIRELQPRVLIDESKNRVYANGAILTLIYSNNGTIPDRGYYGLKIRDSGALIGELDEEFVWERRIGDTFLLGTQHWKIVNITTKDVEVVPWHGAASMTPFWKADASNRPFHVSRAILDFLEEWNDKTESEIFIEHLKTDFFMNDSAARILSKYLELQKNFTGPVLPHRHHIIIEHVEGSEEDLQPYTLLHTQWGNLVNYPFMLALSAAWENKYGEHLDMSSSNDVIFIGKIIDSSELKTIVNPLEIEQLLRNSLEKSNFFGARFRENAGRALLLPRFNPTRRIPFWVTREKSKRLFNAVRNYADFPLLVETWRTCLLDDFDLDSLNLLLDEIRHNEITVTTVKTEKGSPFSGWMQWNITNTKLYQDDTPYPAQGSTSVSESIIKTVVFNKQLRPAINKHINSLLIQRLQRTAPGYAPSSVLELTQWVKDRLCIPDTEWDKLLAAVSLESNQSYEQLKSATAENLCLVKLPGATVACVTMQQTVPVLAELFNTKIQHIRCQSIVDLQPITTDNLQVQSKSIKRDQSNILDAYSFITQWLEFYGPVKPSFLNQVFGIDEKLCKEIICALVSQNILAEDITIDGECGSYICDSQNLERLFRMMRNASKRAFKALPIKYLSLFLAEIQQLTKRDYPKQDLRSIIQLFFGNQINASIWESEIFTSRIPSYRSYQLDSLLSNYNLQWIGCPLKKITFCFTEEVNIMIPFQSKSTSEAIPFTDSGERYSYTDLLLKSKMDSASFEKIFWKDVWSSLISSDSYESIRKGELDYFGEKRSSNATKSLTDLRNPYQKSNPSPNLISFQKWKANHLLPGNWYRVSHQLPSEDPVCNHQLNRERVRQLLARYGILFREILVNESPLFQWKNIFKTLRIMELSGEVISGQFFDHIPGLQFISPSSLRVLEKVFSGEDTIYRINAADPASLCAIDLPEIKQCFPERLTSTHLFFHGPELVMISRKNGLSIECRFGCECKYYLQYIELLKEIACRAVKPVNPIKIQNINGVSVFKSEYLNCFKQAGFIEEYKYLSFTV